MATYTKFNDFVEQLGLKTHNFGGTPDTLKLALTNAANPPAATDAVLTDITQIADGGGYTAGGFTLAGVGWSETAGTATLVANDYTFVASGAVSPFQYAVIYNDTATNKNLLGFWDRGSELTLGNGEQVVFDFTTGQVLSVT